MDQTPTRGSPKRNWNVVRRNILVSFNSTTIGKLVQDFKKSNPKFDELIGTCKINAENGTCPRWCELQESGKLGNAQKTQLYDFRESLVNYVKKKICLQCVDFGSKNLTSNVDVTLNHVDIQVNINTLREIQGFLTQLFEAVCMFQTSDEDGEQFVDLYKVSRFFDLNFYLTNFALTLPKKRYATSNTYGIYISRSQEDRLPMSQYVYAFHEILYNLNLAGANVYSGIYKQTYDHLITIITRDISPATLKQEKTGYSNLIGKISGVIDQIRSFTSVQNPSYSQQDKVNELYDLVSLLSTLEDECYHTQGSYFHVVLAMQAKQNVDLTPQMLCASAIENLCFAYSHRSKSNKYMTRVFDALKRMPPLSEQLENNIISVISSLQSPLLPSGEYGNYEQIPGTILALLGLIFPDVRQGGAGVRLKKLIDKTGTQVKKLIKGRIRNVYVDARRRQYVKFKNQYIRLTAI